MRRLMFASAALLCLCAVMPSPLKSQTQEASARPHTGVAFETSDNCLACHNGLVSPDGEDVSIGASWRASMMANSARDPYWQASVRREVIDHPASREAIEDECSLCHMPMATASARAQGKHGEVFRLLPTSKEDAAEKPMAADGVSCTLCHQISSEKLGTRESFVGGFVLQPPVDGTPRMLGPYNVDEGRSVVMRSSTGAQPTEAPHMRESELCATCHTLITNALGPDGRVIGSLPEQMPYAEWRHSAFARERSCQSCHMPEVRKTPIASVLGEPRDQLSRHTFLGGNFFMLRMLNRFRAELGVTAPSQELDAAAHGTIRQLQTDTASVAVTEARVTDGRLEAVVVVRNIAGHKLPTGYPSRRAWLHVTARDSQGRVLFESGAVTPRGLILGNDGDADPLRVEPHYQEVRRDDEVQIYESVMADGAGVATTGLLRATQFIKDNRLLPRGFDKATAAAEIAVRGTAGQDADFIGGEDSVRYSIPLTGAPGPLALDVELRYQPIGFRWADNLRSYNAPEPRRFVGFYDAMAAASSTVLARDTRSVP